MAYTVCRILGLAFLVAGLVGFVQPHFLGFHLTTIHNVVHLATAAVALYLGFAVCLAVAHSAGDLRKRRVDDLTHGARRATVTRELRGAPDRLEALDEIGR